MTTGIAPEIRPQLKPGCRFSETPGQESVLLIPEGLIKVAGPGRRILDLCNGQRSFAQVVAALKELFPAAPPDRIERDTTLYLEGLRDRGVVVFL